MNMTLYERLEFLCKYTDRTPADVCRAIGASKSLFTDLKTGRKSSVSLETAVKLADYFQISLDFLAGRIGFDAEIEAELQYHDKLQAELEELKSKLHTEDSK